MSCMPCLDVRVAPTACKSSIKLARFASSLVTTTNFVWEVLWQLDCRMMVVRLTGLTGGGGGLQKAAE